MAYSDRFPIVKNFFETQLVVACDAGATELHLADIGGLPAVLVGRDYIPLVVRKATGSREIVYVESVDAGSGTVRVQRGQEGTLATSWDVGAYVYCTVTAESFQRMRVNGFAPLVDPDGGRPAITRTSATAISITGDFSSQIEVGMAVRAISGNTVVVPSDAALGAIFVGSVSYSGGKTLVGLQNVSLPSTVSGLDLGISVASAPLYHPDTPLGDGETITMEGGLLKITDKFKQAQSARDAKQDEAISAAQTAASAAQATANQKLDTAGGLVTGDVTMRGTLVMEPLTGEGGQFLLNAAADDMTSGSLLFDTAWGAFRIFGLPSRDGVTHPNLGAGFVWNPHANQLIVGDKHVVRSVNGVNADAVGNVVISVPATPNAYITETWSSGTSWYRKWSDGWIEQGGEMARSGSYKEATLTLHTAFTTTNYSVLFSYSEKTTTTTNGQFLTAYSKTNTAFITTHSTFSKYWYAFGY